MATEGNTKTLYGLIGYPLEHSFSMRYFNDKFASEGIRAEYLNYELEDIGQLMEILAENPTLRGLNVTIPYKEQVLPYLTDIDEDARAIGAVNVIKIEHDENGEVIALKGYNTDAVAFGRAIEPLLTPERNKALVLGTGGASKAVCHALRKLGVACELVSRRKSASTIAYEELTRAMMQSHKIVVNTTPLGMYPHVDECPDIPYRFLGGDHLCIDLTYNPDETLFMKKSRAQGATVKNGLEMLLLQAFASYEIWSAQ